jgi:hypothetical protein
LTTPAAFIEAFLWEERRTVTKTATPFGHNRAGMLHRHAAHGEAVARIGWCVAEHRIGVISGEVGAGKPPRYAPNCPLWITPVSVVNDWTEIGRSLPIRSMPPPETGGSNSRRRGQLGPGWHTYSDRTHCTSSFERRSAGLDDHAQ